MTPSSQTSSSEPPRADVLVLNAGSATLKFAVFAVPAPAEAAAPERLQSDRRPPEGGPVGTDAPRRRLSGMVDAIAIAPRLRAYDAQGGLRIDRQWPARAQGAAAAADALDGLLAWLAQDEPGLRPAVIGHRIVMGGAEFTAPALLDDASVARLQDLASLAPLHQPAGLAGIREARARFPDVPQVACFDTAFHRRHPAVHDRYALPRRFRDAGLRRFGFHGLSYEFIAGRLPALDPRGAAGRTIVAHLGSGASLCALQAGQSVASTMGFSTLDGLPMGTRCGQLDPGVVLWMLEAQRMDAGQIAQVLYHESGLAGLSGLSSDLRTLEASALPDARTALDYFDLRVRMGIGELAAALGGLDCLVFTGGIGEHSARTRAQVLEPLGWLGLDLDPDANARAGTTERGAVRISSAGSRITAWVIPTDEEATIAGHALQALAGTCPMPDLSRCGSAAS
jgi:acetate kinase